MDYLYLFQQSKFFYKRALKVSLTKTTDSFLSKLNGIKDFDKRIEFAEKHLKRIGEGSSRMVFEFKSGLILKIAKNKKGLVQNIQESLPSMRRSCVNKVLASDIDGKWVIVKFVEKITKEQFEKFTDMNFKNFGSTLYYVFNNEQDLKKSDEYKDIKNNSFFNDIVDLVKDNDLQVGDLIKIDSYGLIDKNKIVLTDYGLSRDIYEKFYAE